jgi:BsuBI/PstI restriction endonuclease domain
MDHEPDLKLRREEEQRYWRIRELLEATNLYTPQRAAVLLVLTDDALPSPIPVLAHAGLPLGACGTTASVFKHAIHYLDTNAAKIDREARDFHVAPLRRPGRMIERVQVPNAGERAATGLLIVEGWPKAKNQFSGHRATAEVRDLLIVDDEHWAEALTMFLSADAMRERQARAGAAAQKVRADSPHAELIRIARDAQIHALAEQGATYHCIYIDDTDGDRVSSEEAAELEARGLSFGGNWRYPDALLVDDNAHEVWIVDAVTSDGEVDENRAEDFIDAFAQRGWNVAGFTTAYRTWADLVRRQSGWRNLAHGTNLWIAEDGGKFLHVGSAQRYL